jgi:hypothetical protein
LRCFYFLFFKCLNVMKRKLFSIKGFLSLLMATIAISACKDDDPTGPPSLYVGEVTTFAFAPVGETKTIELQTNVEVSLNTQSTAAWCEVSLSGKILTVKVERNSSLADRSTTVEVFIPGKSETLTFTQGGQSSVKFLVDTAYASSEQPNSVMAYTYDGITDGSAHYHSEWNSPGGPFELVYELQTAPVLELAMVVYYPRPKTTNNEGQPVCPNGTFGTVSVAVSVNNGPFEIKKQDYTIGDPSAAGAASYPVIAYIELDEPVANVTAVKIIVDGLSSKGGFASCAEMEFYGTGSPTVTEPYLVLNSTSYDFAAEGGSTSISFVTNATSLTASGAGWCTITTEGGFVSITAPENSSGRFRDATITVTGDNGATAQIAITQPRTVNEDNSVQLTVDVESSSVDSWYFDEGTTGHGEDGLNDGLKNGPLFNLFDGSYATYWHSNYSTTEGDGSGPVEGPHTLDIHLASASSLSYINYYTRGYPGGSNGNWGVVVISVKRGGDWVEVMTYNCKQKDGRSQIVMPEVLSGVTDVRIYINQQNLNGSELRFFSE